MECPIKTIVTDSDGVLTDGKFVYDRTGKIQKTFGPHDMDGIKLLQSVGINIIAISADKKGWPITKKRLDDMRLENYFVAELERRTWFADRYDHNTTAFVGDGIWDAATLKQCVLSYAPANATKIAKNAAKVVLETKGGEGVFLEIAENIVSRYFPGRYYAWRKELGIL